MKIIIYLSLIFVISCSDDTFKKVERLENFRILGVLASSPEVAPGGTSNVQLFVSDVKGAGRSLTGTVEACIDPGISVGASVTCDHDPSKQTGSYTIDTINDADLGAANLYTGLASATFTANVPATILVGRSTREENNGVAYIVIFRFSIDGESVEVFRRILVTTRGTKNSNPTISSLALNGSALSTKPLKDDKLTVSANAPETYDFISDQGATEIKSEKLEVAWYVSSGKFDKPKSDVGEEVKYGDDPPSDPLVLAVLVRDERGGLAVDRVVLP